jgi:hypothetical protein
MHAVRGSALKATRKISVGLLSLTVLAGAALYLVAPSTEALAMTVSVHSSRALGHAEILYGSVKDYQGVPMHHAEMVFGTTTDGRRVVYNTLFTHPNGAFRGKVAVHTGEYFVQLIVTQMGTLSRGRRISECHLVTTTGCQVALRSTMSSQSSRSPAIELAIAA